jgi:diguanylate cyclase (GGDEF)-like protein/PAS domain S-box-containing protein
MATHDASSEQVADDALLDALAVGVVVQSAAGEILHWNRKAEEILKLPADQLRGRIDVPAGWRLLNEQGEEHAPGELPLERAVQTGATQHDAVMGIARGDEPVQWVLVTSKPGTDADGTVLSVTTTFHDITRRIDDRRRVEQHLGIERALFRVARGMLQVDGVILDEAVDRALAEIGELFGLSSVRAFVVEDDGTIHNPYWWSSGRRGQLAYVSCLQMQALEEPTRGNLAIVHTDELAPDAQDALRYIGLEDVGSFFSVRLSNDGADLGILLFASRDRRDWRQEEIAIGQHVAALIGATVASRRSADARRRAEEFMQSVLEHSADLIVVIEPATGRPIYISPIVENLLGYTVDTLLGRSVIDLVHPDDHEALFEGFSALMERRHGEDPPTELRLRHADGSWLWVECNGYPLTEEGEVVAAVVNVRDVTERHTQREEMADMLSRFTEVWDHSPLGMALVSLDSVYVDVNKAHCDLLGYTREALVGQPVSKVLGDEEIALLVDAAGALVDGREKRVAVEVQMKRADDVVVWGRIGISLVRDSAGQPRYAVATVEDVTELRQLRGQLEHEATHDDLTRLPLRGLLLDMLARSLLSAQRRGNSVAALFIDLDRFKAVNDTLGHAAGDAVLEEFSRRLCETMRGGDVAGRLGGDEFVVICSELTDTLDARGVAERVLHAASEPFFVDGVEVVIGASVGIAVSDGDIDPEILLWQADTAAYRAKAGGRDRYEVFDDDLRSQVARKLDTEGALRDAIERDELVVWYQPIVKSDTAEWHAVEGLARWQRPEHGLVPPSEFLAVAEDAGLIVPLGLRVIEVGCEQLATWQRTSWPEAKLTLNISARQLLQRGFARSLRRRVVDSGCNPHGLILEITEHSLMHDIDMARMVFQELKADGVRIAIDDFGAGYSSLSQLRRLPVDVLKMDRSFVNELDTDDDAIISSVVKLAAALGMDLIAEGIENRYQAKALLTMGCKLMQGFYFSPALPPDEVDKRLGILWSAA